MKVPLVELFFERGIERLLTGQAFEASFTIDGIDRREGGGEELSNRPAS